jgi:hypothetical protein
MAVTLEQVVRFMSNLAGLLSVIISILCENLNAIGTKLKKLKIWPFRPKFDLSAISDMWVKLRNQLMDMSGELLKNNQIWTGHFYHRWLSQSHDMGDIWPFGDLDLDLSIWHSKSNWFLPWNSRSSCVKFGWIWLRIVACRGRTPDILWQTNKQTNKHTYSQTDATNQYTWQNRRFRQVIRDAPMKSLVERWLGDTWSWLMPDGHCTRFGECSRARHQVNIT